MSKPLKCIIMNKISSNNHVNLEQNAKDQFNKAKAEIKYIRQTQKHLTYGKKVAIIQSNLNGSEETLLLNRYEKMRLIELNLFYPQTYEM